MVWFANAFGEEIEIRVGDKVYVDEGDSFDCREMVGVVAAVTPERVLLQDGRTFRPHRCTDVQVKE